MAQRAPSLREHVRASPMGSLSPTKCLHLVKPDMRVVERDSGFDPQETSLHCIMLTRCYSITSSEMESSVAGTSTPIARAVAKLMTNSDLVDLATGRSAGFSPLRMRPT
jgi:hypothetical protein